MISLIRRLFGSPRPQSKRMVDPDFGAIEYVEPSSTSPCGYWRMEGTWAIRDQKQGVRCAEVPGNELGPSDLARTFLLALRREPERAWAVANDQLLKLVDGWPNLQDQPLRDVFFISSLSMDSDNPNGWEVCFETHNQLKWLNFCVQVEGDEVVSNTIYT